MKKIAPAEHSEWIESFSVCEKVEKEKVIEPEIHPRKPLMNMGEVARKVSEATGNDSILVTDVGQNQCYRPDITGSKDPAVSLPPADWALWDSAFPPLSEPR